MHHTEIAQRRRHCGGLQARSRPFGSAESVKSLAFATRLGVLIRALALTINLHRISVPAASGPQHQNAGLFVFASLLLLVRVAAMIAETERAGPMSAPGH
jgi:hypothetical protein